MKRSTRNRLLFWIIIAGLVNFAAYTALYWHFEGDARNGFIRFEPATSGAPAAAEGIAAGDDAALVPVYYLRGHFIRMRLGMASAPVSRGVWVYSFVHSISIWPTIGAILVSMLILARPHLIATMESEALPRGRWAVNAGIVVVLLVTLSSALVFVLELAHALDAVAEGRNYGL